MKVLAWDTSSRTGVICALDGTKLVAELTLNVDLQHSERLLWGIDEVMQSARWKLPEIDAIGVGVGPGSFTGVRIGLTTARTLAQSLNKPLAGVSSLAALARPAAEWLSAHPQYKKNPTLIIASTDACKGELFAMVGEASSVSLCARDPILWKRGVVQGVYTSDQLISIIKTKLKKCKTWCVLGESVERYPDLWKLLPKKQQIQLPGFWNHQIQGRMVAKLASEMIEAGQAKPALEVLPEYLRASSAEIQRLAKI